MRTRLSLESRVRRVTSGAELVKEPASFPAQIKGGISPLLGDSPRNWINLQKTVPVLTRPLPKTLLTILKILTITDDLGEKPKLDDKKFIVDKGPFETLHLKHEAK